MSYTKEILRWSHITGAMILFASVFKPVPPNTLFVDATT